MSIFSSIVNKYKRAAPKQLVIAGVFMLALAGAIGGGFASQSKTSAFQGECDDNAIMRCGASSKSEFIDKVEANNTGRNGDLPKIYGHFGLTSSQYADFEAHAQYGTFYRDGRIEVAGQTVADNGHSMGRHSYSGSKAYSISGAGTYYYGTPTQRWANGTSSLPVMVWFDDNGEAKMVIMNPCGNPVPYFNKKSPSYSCDALNKHAVSGKKNTYKFSADASNNNLAKVTKFTYSYNDGSGWKVFDTTTSESAETKEITFVKASKVRVEIEVQFMNGKKKTNITSVLCEKEVGVVKEEFLYVCETLLTTTTDNRTFRFSAVPKHSNNVTAVSANFTLDGKTTVKDITAKDGDGNFYRDYTFTDKVSHTVSAVINFQYEEDGVVKKVQSKQTCKKTVTPEQPPVCEHNPKLPPNHPDCKKPECVEKPGSGFPPGDPRCKEYCKPNIEVGSKDCEELPVTGPGGVAGLFAGVTVAGAVGHRLFTSFRSRRS